MSVNFYNNVSTNKNRTIFLLTMFLLVIIGLGWLFARVYDSPIILLIAIVVSVAQSLVSYYSGDKIALAVTGAREISSKDDLELFRIVENLSMTAGLPMPKIYLINDISPNAFATGRDPQHASLAVTSGLRKLLTKSELEGVIAHELSHIGNYDILLMTVVAVLVGVVAIMSDIFIRSRYFFGGRGDNKQANGILVLIGLLAALLAPLVATLVQLAISRKREFLADSSGVLITRYPEGLASALEKISNYNQPMKKVSSATNHLFISNPNGMNKMTISGLFSTHPPIKERIDALMGMNIKEN